MNVWIVVAIAAAALLLLRRVLVSKAPPELVRAKLQAGATVVDVRTPGEFARGHHAGAVNVPLGALPGRLAEIPRDRPVVLYCASGARSASAARLLRRAGYVDVVNAGGLGDLTT
jgi:phage shock protein E